jgi:hypothetical protein
VWAWEHCTTPRERSAPGGQGDPILQTRPQRGGFLLSAEASVGPGSGAPEPPSADSSTHR